MFYMEAEKNWRLSPAYDLTYSNTYYGEHTTTVDGNGKNPGLKELVAVGMQAGLSKEWCTKEAMKVEELVHETFNNSNYYHFNHRLRQ